MHHEVYGILRLLGTGTVEFAYRPGAPWLQLLLLGADPVDADRTMADRCCG